MLSGHASLARRDVAELPGIWRADEPALSCAAAGTTRSGFDSLDAQLPGGGWPQGQLIELLHDDPGIGELSLLAPALAAQSRAGRACVWVLPCTDDPLQHALPYPPALIEAGIDPSGSILVRPTVAREAWWAIEQSLRAAHVGALIGWLPGSGAAADFRALRRLHLLAQQHRALVFVIRPAHCAQAPSPAMLRLLLARDGSPQHSAQPAPQQSLQSPQLNIKILKRRGRPLLEPVAVQVHPQRWQRSTVPSSGAAHAATVKPRHFADALTHC